LTDIPGTEHLSEDEHSRLLRDLERRIETLSGAGESEFGAFTPVDWIACIAAFVVLPYLLYWWFWP
jgi:hypothetical protein